MKKLTYLFLLISFYSQAQITLGKNSPAQTIVSGYTSPGGLSSNPGDLWISQIGGIGNLWGKRNSNWYQFFQTVDTNSILATQYYVNTHGGGGAGIGYASNGLSKSGDTVILGGQLNANTAIQAQNKEFGIINTDTTSLLIFQEDTTTSLSSYAIGNAGTGFLLVQNKGVTAQYRTESNGDYQYLNVDSFQADLRIDVDASGDRYQCGVYNNDADESDYTSELSIHNIGVSKDIYSLRLHKGWLDYMIDGDTSDLSPDAYGVFHRDSTMFEIGRTNHSANTYASRFVQDTAFYFKWDSSAAYLNHYYNSDTVYIKSNKEIKFGSNVSFSNILSGSATLDFGTITANGHEVLTFSVSGASAGDVVSLGIPDASMDAHASFIAWVSSANTVSVKCFNFDGTSFNPASGTFKVKIFK